MVSSTWVFLFAVKTLYGFSFFFFLLFFVGVNTSSGSCFASSAAKCHSFMHFNQREVCEMTFSRAEKKNKKKMQSVAAGRYSTLAFFPPPPNHLFLISYISSAINNVLEILSNDTTTTVYFAAFYSCLMAQHTHSCSGSYTIWVFVVVINVTCI